jgi:exodeoxyribonuclease V beta subunit
MHQAPPSPRPDWRPLLTWSPQAAPLEPTDESARYEQLRGQPRRLESYSSLKRRGGGYAQTGLVEQDLRIDEELGSSEEAVGPQELPGGVRTGQLLHDVLEHLDYSTLTRYLDHELWMQDPQVDAVFRRAMIEHGLDLGYLTLTKRIILRALTSTVQTPHTVIYGVAFCNPSMREVEFLYPIPARPDHPSHLLYNIPATDTHSDRGFIKGYIDYMFEHRRRLYFVDWKSDILERYDISNISKHFEANFIMQSLLYTLSICRMFLIHSEADYEERFGGAIYCFLRGMSQEGDQGILLHRATWGELMAFAGELIEVLEVG